MIDLEKMEKDVDLNNEILAKLNLFKEYERRGESELILSFLEGKKGRDFIIELYKYNEGLTWFFTEEYMGGREEIINLSLPDNAEQHLRMLGHYFHRSYPLKIGNMSFDIKIKILHKYNVSFVIFSFLVRKYIKDEDIVLSILSLSPVIYQEISKKVDRELQPILNLMFELSGKLRDYMAFHIDWNTEKWFQKTLPYLDTKDLSDILVDCYFNF
jgi:hypothetical protein